MEDWLRAILLESDFAAGYGLGASGTEPGCALAAVKAVFGFDIIIELKEYTLEKNDMAE
jgi:hypothetical protein